MNAREVAAVLAQHWATRLESGYTGKWACTCGEGIAPKTDAAHQEHMAAEVVKALEGDGGPEVGPGATESVGAGPGATRALNERQTGYSTLGDA